MSMTRSSMEVAESSHLALPGLPLGGNESSLPRGSLLLSVEPSCRDNMIADTTQCLVGPASDEASDSDSNILRAVAAPASTADYSGFMQPTSMLSSVLSDERVSTVAMTARSSLATSTRPVVSSSISQRPQSSALAHVEPSSGSDASSCGESEASGSVRRIGWRPHNRRALEVSPSAIALGIGHHASTVGRGAAAMASSVDEDTEESPVQETTTVGTVTIQLPVSQLPAVRTTTDLFSRPSDSCGTALDVETHAASPEVMFANTSSAMGSSDGSGIDQVPSLNAHVRAEKSTHAAREALGHSARKGALHLHVPEGQQLVPHTEVCVHQFHTIDRVPSSSGVMHGTVLLLTLESCMQVDYVAAVLGCIVCAASIFYAAVRLVYGTATLPSLRAYNLIVLVVELHFAVCTLVHGAILAAHAPPHTRSARGPHMRKSVRDGAEELAASVSQNSAGGTSASTPSPGSVRLSAGYRVRVMIACATEPLLAVQQTVMAALRADVPGSCCRDVYLCALPLLSTSPRSGDRMRMPRFLLHMQKAEHLQV